MRLPEAIILAEILKDPCSSASILEEFAPDRPDSGHMGTLVTSHVPAQLIDFKWIGRKLRW